jgi:hypothetical protein
MPACPTGYWVRGRFLLPKHDFVTAPPGHNGPPPEISQLSANNTRPVPDFLYQSAGVKQVLWASQTPFYSSTSTYFPLFRSFLYTLYIHISLPTSKGGSWDLKVQESDPRELSCNPLSSLAALVLPKDQVLACLFSPFPASSIKTTGTSDLSFSTHFSASTARPFTPLTSFFFLFCRDTHRRILVSGGVRKSPPWGFGRVYILVYRASLLLPMVFLPTSSAYTV